MCLELTPLFVMAKYEGHPRASLIVAGARTMLGRPFLPQGRSEQGQDCLGLVLAAAQFGGIRIGAHSNLPLRGLRIEEACELMEKAGCRLLSVSEAQAGDVLLQAPAARQIHLSVFTGHGIVEAHGGLRRVIERPLAAGEHWHSAWRLPKGDD